MNSTLFNDRRAAGLLNRVREDVGHLRDDIGSLLTHTTKKTLPNSARDLTAHARQGLAAGGAYAASRLRDLRGRPHRQPAGWVGGALVLGLLAYGAYSFLKSDSRQLQDEDPADFPAQDDLI